MNFNINFNNLDIGGTQNYITVTQLDGVTEIPIRTSRADLLTGHGGNIFRQLYSPRSISINGAVRGDTEEQFFQKIEELSQAYSIVTTPTLMSITRWDNVTRYIYAKVITMPIIPLLAGQNTIARYRTELLAENPFFLGDLIEEVLTIVAPEGFPLAAPLPMPLGSIQQSSTTINNTGSVEGYASFRITGVCNTPSVTNLSTGKQFTIQRSLGGGEFVDITYINGVLSVILNGTTNIISQFSGDIFALQPGNNTIAFNAITYNDAASLTISFRPHFLTIGA